MLMNNLPKTVKLIEVGPRDGLQNEALILPVDVKVAFINQLAAAGFANIEAAAFVSPKWVPQMANSTDVMAGVVRRPGTIYSALVPNMQGFDAALAAGVDEVVIFGSASQTFSQKNINCSIAESIARFKPVAQAAKEHHLRLRGSISCAFACPYQGEVSLQDVATMVCYLRDLGCDEVDLADTIGVATPNKVYAVIAAAAKEFPLTQLAGHYHDTYGQGVANVYASLEMGMQIFHSSVAGLGGCPYALGAAGNVATEDILFLLEGLGISTGVDMRKIVEAAQYITKRLNKKNSRAGGALAKRYGLLDDCNK